jgi:hypothetical protein
MAYYYLYILIVIMVLLSVMIDLYNQFNTHTEPLENLSPEETAASNFLLDKVYQENNPISFDMLSKYNERRWRDVQPIKVGSYEQTTNNIEFPINPDIGTCMPTEFCYTFYKNNMIRPKETVSDMVISDDSFVKQNSEYTDPNHNVRVGYFSTKIGPFF